MNADENVGTGTPAGPQLPGVVTSPPSDEAVVAEEKPIAPPLNGKPTNWVSNAFGVIFAVVLTAGIVLPPILAGLGIGGPELELIALASQDDKGTHLSGRVLQDGDPVDQAQVWALATDDFGNQTTSTLQDTENGGAFSVELDTKPLGNGEVNAPLEVIVFAKRTIKASDADEKDKTIRGQQRLTLGRRSSTRWVEFSAVALLSVPGIFISSVGLALIQSKNPSSWLSRIRYYGSLVLAFLFTSAMIIFISLGLKKVNATGSVGDVLALGYANIYHGTYVEDVPPEWLFSLTSPATTWTAPVAAGVPPGADANSPATTQPAITSNALARGFGVPLWVMLISVVGAGVFTISLIVKGIDKPVDFAQNAQIRARVQEVVMHQFYILFAPFGAVMVYQLMVAAGTASETITVAIAAFASGLALNVLLDKALKAMQKV